MPKSYSYPADFSICGALTYDGLGNKPVIADVVVKDGKIKAVDEHGKLNLTGIAQIEAKGLSLSPGFIDVHGHSDITIMEDPWAKSRISQGVTMEIIGNCGDSKAILPNGKLPALLKEGEKIAWSDMTSYSKELDRREPAINIASLCGHNTIRQMVLGLEDVKPGVADITRMKGILSDALEQGAAGFSSGLWYVPGKYSDTEEVMALSELLRGTGKPYATHMRDEGDSLIESVEEAVKIAENGSGKLQISHVKTYGPKNWGKLDALVATVGKARSRGMRVFADRYPYIYSATSLRMILPPPYDKVGDIPKLLESDAECEKLVSFLERQETLEDKFETAIVCDSGEPAEADLFGLTLGQIAKRLRSTPARVCVEMLRRPCYIHTAFKLMCEENMRAILSLDWVMPGSDGYSLPFDYSLLRSHPRSFGTFPRFFRVALDTAPAEEVIRRMTSLPASVFNIPGRGVIREGFVADLVLFNEAEYDSNADFSNPHAMCGGVDRVFVDGRLAFSPEDVSELGRFGKFIKL